MITWQTQETECWRKGTQWDEVVVGNPDVVLKVRYAIAITRVPENVDDEVTGGWKIVEVRFKITCECGADGNVDGQGTYASVVYCMKSPFASIAGVLKWLTEEEVFASHVPRHYRMRILCASLRHNRKQ
jgi:hypothetical protein